MLICEAVKEAQNSNKYIARLHHSFKIKPTNEPECCIVVKKTSPPRNVGIRKQRT